jgi:hypothetical protein
MCIKNYEETVSYNFYTYPLKTAQDIAMMFEVIYNIDAWI